jgi:hypothetical protein
VSDRGTPAVPWLTLALAAMKKAKAQPSLLGLILLVGGMLLLSIVALGLVSSGNLGSDGLKTLLALAIVAVISLIAGASLSGRKRKRAN